MMKKIITFLSIIFLFILFIPKSKAYTSYPIDNINSYTIYASVRDDATIDFHYIIEWRVLGTDEDGRGVTWVKVGVPNKYCYDVESTSSCVKKAYYYIDGTSTCIRLDLNREYNPGETFILDFTFHQTHMFTYAYDEDKKLVSYEFIPGWFDDIAINKLNVYWNKANVYYSECKSEDETYLIWERTNMSQGERTKIRLSYFEGIFPNIDPKATFRGDKDFRKMNRMILIIAIVIVVVNILMFIYMKVRRASYYRTRGFYPYGRRFFFRNYYYGVDSKGTRKPNPYISSGGSGHSGGHSCACACACACAGGGRAGCSKKDFYKGKIDIEEFLEEDK